jgi:hypothetical protein
MRPYTREMSEQKSFPRSANSLIWIKHRQMKSVLLYMLHQITCLFPKGLTTPNCPLHWITLAMHLTRSGCSWHNQRTLPYVHIRKRRLLFPFGMCILTAVQEESTGFSANRYHPKGLKNSHNAYNQQKLFIFIYHLYKISGFSQRLL